MCVALQAGLRNLPNYLHRKLFVGGIARQTTEDSLRKHFEAYGEVSDCILMKDKDTGNSRGFGFVTYKDPNCIQAVLKARPHTLDNKMVCGVTYSNQLKGIDTFGVV